MRRAKARCLRQVAGYFDFGRQRPFAYFKRAHCGTASVELR